MEKVVEKNTENITTMYDINFQTDRYAAAAQRDTCTPGHVAAPAAPSPLSQSPPLPQPQPQPQLQPQTSEGHPSGGTAPNRAGQNSVLPSNRVTTQSDNNGDRGDCGVDHRYAHPAHEWWPQGGRRPQPIHCQQGQRGIPGSKVTQGQGPPNCIWHKAAWDT